MKLKQLIGFAFLLLFVTSASVFAQKKKVKSPPMEAKTMVNTAEVTINYGAPSVRNRTVWGNLVPYDKVWRTGANEATTFTTSKAITVEGKTLPAGKYSLFTIPQEDGNWTIIFNSVADQWGAYSYSKDKDVLRVDVKAASNEEVNEMMRFDISEDGKVALMWDKLMIPFTIK